MATELTTRIIELDVRISAQALAALKAQAQALRDMENRIKQSQAAVKEFSRVMISGFVFREAVGAISGVIKAMDELVDTSTQLGLSVEDLQQWQHAAEMSGATAEEFQAGVRGLSKSMADMTNETAKSTVALKAMGVTAGDTTQQALDKLVAGFSQMQDGPQKTALAMDIFGKAGAKLIPMLNEGTKGIEAFRKEAEELGIIVSGPAAKAAQELGDAVDRMQKAVFGLTAQMAEGLIPALTAITTGFTDASKSANGFRETGELVGGTLIYLTKLAIGVVSSFQLVGKTFGAVIAAGVARRDGWRAAGRAFSEGMADVSESAETAGERINKLETDYEAFIAKAKAAREAATTRGFMRSGFEGSGLQVKPDEGGTGGDKPKRDETLEFLQKFTEQTNAAAAAVKEMTAAERLNFELSNKGYDLKTQAQLKAFVAAQQAARAEDARKETMEFNSQRERERLEFEAKRTEELKAGRDAAKALREEMLNLADPTRQIMLRMEKLTQAMSDPANADILPQLQQAMSVLQNEFVKAVDGATTGTDQLNESMKQLAKTMESGLTQFASDAAGAIVDAFSGAKIEIDKIVNSILASMAKLLLQQLILNSMKGAFPQFFKAADGEAFGFGGNVVPIRKFASGGVIGGPTMFSYAGGAGLMGEAGPEAIVPLRRTSSGDLGVQASPVVINITNNAGDVVKAEESQSTSGERRIQIMIDKAVEEGWDAADMTGFYLRPMGYHARGVKWKTGHRN